MNIDISEAEEKLVRGWIYQMAFFMAVYTPIFFFIAGSMSWGWGWVYFIILGLFLAAHPLLLVPINPGLLAERARGINTEGTKRWDKVVAGVGAGIMPFASQILSAFDYRFTWSSLSTAVNFFGLVIIILGYLLFLWAMVSNAFFAEGVRIQTERGHAVCGSGPYRWVRHPGYVGSILSIIGTPLLLDSLWGLIPSLMGAAAFILRTVLEDLTLQDELKGYKSYTERVRYKLIPGIF